MKRFLFFLLANITVAAIIIFLFISGERQPVASQSSFVTIFTAALLGVWPLFSFSVYDRFINVPVLDIAFDNRDPDTYKPTLDLLIRKPDNPIQKVPWNFLRVAVKNSGFGVARNCTAELRIISRPVKNYESCPAPAREPKSLKWAGDTPNIPPRGGEGILDVLIRDATVSNLTGTDERAKTWGSLVAWAATTHGVWSIGPEHRNQDGFCEGDYVARLTVFPENGTPKSKKFKLHISANWEDTTIIWL